MKKSVLGVLILSSTMLFTGCRYTVTSKVVEDKVQVYNDTLDKTLKTYITVLSKAKENNSYLLDYLVTDVNIASVLNIKDSDTLSEEYKEALEINGVVQDYYFTSYGATGLREVIILNSPRNTMYATVVWDEDGDILSIKRVVRAL